MSSQPLPKPCGIPRIYPYLCSQGIARLRAACKGNPAELEALEVRLLLSGLVSSSDQTQATSTDPTGLVTTDASATQAAAGTADTGLASLSDVIDALASYNWDPALPTRTGYSEVNGVQVPFTESRNQPIGNDSYYSIYPGRVVWVYDPAATNSAAGQTPWVTNNSTDPTTGNFWWQNQYTNYYEVYNMVAQGVMNLTGKTTLADAWDALFRSFNQSHGNAPGGYVSGQTIVIKCNLNTETSTTLTTNQKKNTPQVISAVLDQLVNIVGVPQSDIYIYDDLKDWSTPYWDYYNSTNTSDPNLWSPQERFPQVNWMDNYLGGGRNPSPMSSTPEVYYASGASSYIPQFVVNATYAIDMPVLSGHSDAGVTLCGKNYVGAIGESPNDSPGQNSTIHYHRTPGSAGSPAAMGTTASCFTSFLANEYLGQKNILYLTDALYGGWDWGNDSSIPTPWSMAPFGDGLVDGKTGWPSSLLFSQDPIAEDSVSLDMMWSESTTGLHNLGNLMTNTTYMNADDYLHEAAQLGQPASQTDYLDVGDIPQYLIDQGASASLGVHEHWDNAIDKLYSRNLGTGDGIELLAIEPGAATPNAPSNVVATVASSHQIDLTWTGNSTAETYFKIERATSADFSTGLTYLTEVNAGTTSYSDTTVTPGQTYYYRVRAVNWGTESANAASGPIASHTVVPAAATSWPPCRAPEPKST